MIGVASLEAPLISTSAINPGLKLFSSFIETSTWITLSFPLLYLLATAAVETLSTIPLYSLSPL